MTDGITGRSAIELAADVHQGRIDPLKVIELYLERIDERQPSIGAFRKIRREAALAEAESLGRRDDLNALPLAGVPIAIKDNVDVEGETTLLGSSAVPKAPALSDHEMVRRLRAAGAIVIGKSTMPELGLWPTTDGSFGMTRNPWNAQRGPGGSSGGSAAAVVANMVPIAHGNDGAGSIRIPSAVCGTYGIKPGHGLVPTLEHHWFNMTENGPIATTVDDAALALSVMAAQPELARVETPDRRLTIALSTRPPLRGIRVQREVKDAVVTMGEALQREGHRVVLDDPPYNASARTSAIARWFAGEVEAAHGIDREKLQKRTRGHLRAGALALRLNLVRDSQAQKWHRRVRPLFERYDVVLMPVVSATALDAGPWCERSWLRNAWTSLNFAPYTGLWNFALFPAASIPAGFKDGLPLGVQIVGGPGREATILSLSKEIERLRPWPRHAPL